MELITRRNALLKMNPLKEYTVTGNPAVFETNMAKALTQFLIPFTPVQSGSGDPSPSNVRAISGWTGVKAYRTGSNLIDVSKVATGLWYNGNVIQSYTHFRTTEKIPIVPGAKYSVNRNSNAQNYCSFFGKDGSYLRQRAVATQRTTNTAGADEYFIGLTIGEDYLSTAQMNVGETASAYAPYSGNSYSVTFPALGKNMFNKNAVQDNKVWWKGNLSSIPDYSASEKIPVIPGEKYTLTRDTGNQNALCLFDYDGNYIEQDIYGSYVGYTIPNGVYYVAFSVITTGLDTCQFEKSSSATAYEPYTNTVYGGTLDLATGVLTVEWKGVDLGTLKWSYYSYSQKHGGYSNSLVDEIKRPHGNTVPDCFCNSQKIVSDNTFPVDDCLSVTSNGFIKVIVRNATSSGELKSELDGVILVYELATPVSIQLGPVTIESLIGDNTVWSDTNGANTIKYLKKG